MPSRPSTRATTVVPWCNYVQTNYTDLLENFLQVFVGDMNCQYEFVDDDTMNTVAAGTLAALTHHAASLIRANPAAALGELSDDQLMYAASFAVLSIFELDSNKRSAVIQAEYDGDAGLCSSRAGANRGLYRWLQAFELPPE